jgi:hypothetical protein
VIIVHAGNRVDEPERAIPRFPPHREEAVGARLGELLDLLRPDGVVTGVSAGADLLLAEAAVERDVPVHAVLVCDQTRYGEVSVDDRGPRWTQAYRRILDHIAADSRCSLLELEIEADDAGFRVANGLLLERAAHLDTNGILAVAVRPARRETTASVTDDFVTRAEKMGLFVIEIDPGP